MNGKTPGRAARPAVAVGLCPEDRVAGFKRDLSPIIQDAHERLGSGPIGQRKLQAYRAAEKDLIRTQRELQTIVRSALGPNDLLRYSAADHAKHRALQCARQHSIELDFANAALRKARRWRDRAAALAAACRARRANSEALSAAEVAASTLREIADRLRARIDPEQQGVIECRRMACRDFIEAARRVINAKDIRCPRATAALPKQGRPKC